MNGPISAVPASELTSGAQLFRCIPYSCTMLARACVVRQAQADSDFPPVSLLLCKGCELGAEVKRNAGGDVEVDPHAAARASRKHIKGLPQKPHRALTVVTPLPAAALPPAPPVLTAPSVVQSPQTDEGTVPKSIDLTGKELAGVKVLRQLESKGEGALFQVRFPCKHEEEILGAVLRSYAKNKGTRHCKTCRGAPKPAPVPKTARAPKPVTVAAAPVKRPARPVAPASAASLTHEFPLRRDFKASVTLPSDLSKLDVQRLSRWLDVLVFEDDDELGAPDAAE